MAQTSYSVCYHCKDRTIGCHAKCKMYQEEKAEKERIRKMKEEERMIDTTLSACSKRRSESRLRNKIYKSS